MRIVCYDLGMDFHRRSIRFDGYDYSQSGWYFITICVNNRECMFGDIIANEMKLNIIGRMINEVWYKIPKLYPEISNKSFQIMPNHIHGIIQIVGAGLRACPQISKDNRFEGQPVKQGEGQPRRVAPTVSLPDFVHRFKSFTTREYLNGVKESQWPMVDHRLWQRNYYEHIIRDERDLYYHEKYIMDNPKNWGINTSMNPLEPTIIQ